MLQKENERERDSKKYERIWERRIRQCELGDQKFREREWNREA